MIKIYNRSMYLYHNHELREIENSHGNWEYDPISKFDMSVKRTASRLLYIHLRLNDKNKDVYEWMYTSTLHNLYA